MAHPAEELTVDIMCLRRERVKWNNRESYGHCKTPYTVNLYTLLAEDQISSSPHSFSAHLLTIPILHTSSACRVLHYALLKWDQTKPSNTKHLIKSKIFLSDTRMFSLAGFFGGFSSEGTVQTSHFYMIKDPSWFIKGERSFREREREREGERK